MIFLFFFSLSLFTIVQIPFLKPEKLIFFYVYPQQSAEMAADPLHYVVASLRDAIAAYQSMHDGGGAFVSFLFS